MSDSHDQRAYNRKVIEEFRANGGMLGPPFSGGSVLLLTTIGRRTGRPHTTPMMFKPAGDRLMVIASNIGAPRHPDWYENLVANSTVTVEVGTERYDATATSASGDERAALWAQLLETHPFFADHQAKTEREIPLVLLTRQG